MARGTLAASWVPISVASLVIVLLVASKWKPFLGEDPFRELVWLGQQPSQACKTHVSPEDNLPIFYYLVDPAGQGSLYLRLIQDCLQKLEREPAKREETLQEMLFHFTNSRYKVLDDAAKDALVEKIRIAAENLSQAKESWHMKLLRITRLFNPHNPIRVLTTPTDPNFSNEAARLAKLNVTLRYIEDIRETDPRIPNFENMHKALYGNVSIGSWKADMFTRFCYIADQAEREGFLRVFAVDSDVVFTASTNYISRKFHQAFVSPGDSSSQFILADTAALQSFCDYITKDLYGRPLEDVRDWVRKYGSGRGFVDGQVTQGTQLEDMVMVRGFVSERQDIHSHIIFPLPVEALWMVGEDLPKAFCKVYLPEQLSTMAWAAGLVTMRHQHQVYGDEPFDFFDLSDGSIEWIYDLDGRPQPFYHGYLVPAFHLQGPYRFALPSFMKVFEQAGVTEDIV